MKRPGRFINRKHLYQGLLNGLHLYYYKDHIHVYYDEEKDMIITQCQVTGDTVYRTNLPYVNNLDDWTAINIKPKKRRLIKDHVKQATRLLYSDYVPDENCWYAPDGEIAFYNALWACSGDEVYDTKDGYYNTMKDGSGYEIRKEWTEEYDDDERSNT